VKTTVPLGVIVGSLALAMCAPAFASGGSSFIDGRQWELVSPQLKEGSAIPPISFAGGDIQAAEDGSAITYLASGPIAEPNPEGNTAPDRAQVMSTRAAPGVWRSEDIATPGNGIGALAVGSGYEYKAFSADLGAAVVEPLGETALPAPSNHTPTEQTIYLRDSTNSDVQPVVNEANILAGARLGETFGTRRHIFYRGASSDLTHIVFSSPEKLTKQAVEDASGQSESLYEWSGRSGELGEVKLVSRFPESEALSGAIQVVLGWAESHASVLRDAVSANGSRVIWEARGQEEGSSVTHLYLTDMASGSTARIDKPQAGAASGEPPKPMFEGASSDGTRIFFSDPQALVKEADASEHPERAGEGDLYVYEVAAGASPGAGTLQDLSLDTTRHGGVREEGSLHGYLLGYGGGSGPGTPFSVYFVDSGVLAMNPAPGGHGPAVAGGRNLYVVHADGSAWERPEYLASLSREDSPTWGEQPSFDEVSTAPHLSSRVSSSGGFVAFMSSESLTGFDNRDAVSGVKDEEVFVYDATTKRLLCASCDPSGARPAGVREPASEAQQSLLVDEQLTWRGRWLAGSLPGWTPTLSDDASGYQSRYLTDSGRLFFDAAPGLVPGDVNGLADVYEYEPEGPTCSATAQSQAELYKSENGGGGCVGLISSGASKEESAFLDAGGLVPGGEEAEDVFFLTSSQLAPQDGDSSYDIYDAHECTTRAPCASGGTSVAPACSDTDSCRAAPASQPGTLGAPASATFSGPGNPAPPPVTKSEARTRPLTRRQQLAASLKACRRERGKRRRVVCESAARREYRPIRASGRR
jgi:hypothetical protein